MTLAPATRLGPYEIVAPLGAGGMGEVYRARDTRLGREVAIKVLPAEVAQDAERLHRFEQEARAVSALNHPHIVTLYEVGESGFGPYLVLEKIEGTSLRETLSEGALPVRRLLTLGAQVAEGLAKAHAAGIVHRDLKPDNVMVSEDGFAKILDFGLAKLVFPELGGAAPEAPATRTLAGQTAAGVVLGTLGYLSPEQAAGRPVDFRADQFALGALLYELATGEGPFRRETVPESLTAVIREEPEPLRARNPALPAQLGWIVERCLAKDPNDRYASTRDLARDLADLRDHLSELGRVDAVPTEAPRPGAKRRWATALGIGAAGVGAGFLLAAALGQLSRQGAPPTELAVELLTRVSGVASEPTITPDGKSVVYVRDGHLWLLRVGGSNAIDLTPGGEASFAPAFSPDGQSIAFNSEREGGGIFVMGATGENVRRVTSRGFRPAWTPDGRELVFSSTAAAYLWGGVPTPGLEAVELATGATRQLCDCAALAPAVSPHGLRVAFQGIPLAGRAQRDLWTVPLAGLGPGESPRALTADTDFEWDPQWSGEGDAIEFVSTRGGSPNLWRLAVDEASGAPRSAPTPQLLPAGWVDATRTSADGAVRVFVSFARRSVLSKVAFDPERGRLLGEPREALRLGSAGFGPYYSGWFAPDGGTLAVLSGGGAGPVMDGIALLTLDGSGLRQLVPGRFRARAPTWSPDGRTIAFQSDEGGSYEIWGIGVDGGNLRRLMTSPAGVWSPAWSPDGSRLLAIERDGATLRAVVHRLDEAPERIETLPPMPDGSFLVPHVWSRTGEALFGSDGEGALWRWSMEERAYTRLPFTPSSDTIPWLDSELPDGRLVLYLERLAASGAEVGPGDVARPRLGVDVVLLDPESGEQRRLLTVPGAFRPGIALDPTQRTLWVHRWEEDADLWIARPRVATDPG